MLPYPIHIFYRPWGHRTIIIKHHILKHHIFELPINPHLPRLPSYAFICEVHTLSLSVFHNLFRYLSLSLMYMHLRTHVRTRVYTAQAYTCVLCTCHTHVNTWCIGIDDHTHYVDMYLH